MKLFAKKNNLRIGAKQAMQMGDSRSDESILICFENEAKIKSAQNSESWKDDLMKQVRKFDWIKRVKVA